MPPRSSRPIAVVTGASAGIGRATVRELARAGYDLGLLARNVDALEAAREEVLAAGGRALVCAADVAEADAVDDAAGFFERGLGPIDVWVNNAMVTVVSPIRELDADEVRRVTEVTYLGSVHGTLAALRRMLPRDRGTIVQVGSALAYRAIPLQAPYCGAKFALRGFTDSLRSELLHDGANVRVTMVHLPAHDTPQFDWCRTHMPRQPQPVPPVFAPEVAARAIAWAAAHAPRELNVGWPATQAILANKLVPGLLDRYLAVKGYEGQLGDSLVDANRRDNLWRTVPGDQGASGRFGAAAKPWSFALELRMRRAPLLAAVAVAAIGSMLMRRLA